MIHLRSTRSFPHRPIPFHPWVYFFIFLTSNILLSYFNLSLQAKLWVGVFGLAIPFLLGLSISLEGRRSISPKGKFSWKDSTDKPRRAPPWWLWGVFLFLLFLTRFYKLTSIPFWPLSDEGIFSSLAMDLSRKWHWEFLWTQGRVEPLLIWLLALFYKVFPPSFFALRLFPTLASLASCGLAYWACRQFFSRSFSFMFLWFFSFSFWCFTLMRFCHPNDLIPIFELLAFGLLGLFLRAQKESRQWTWILALGLCCGLGFYAYVNWEMVWFLIGLILLAHGWKEKNHGLKFALVYGALTVLLALPLALARLEPGNLDVIHGKFGPPSLIFSYFDYFYGIFWDSRTSFPFGSNWGGLLNPITDSLVLLGCLYVIGRIKGIFLFWLGLAFILLLLPGTITSNMELHRTTPSLPLWVLLATFGAEYLLTAKLKWGTWGWLSILLLVSAKLTLNGYNFIGPYSNIQPVAVFRQWRSVEYWDAFQSLKAQSDKDGSLCVFSEFNTDYDNKTLNVACYPFDALQNPDLAGSTPKWAALILNSHYAPFLIKEFPGLRFRILKTDKKEPDAAPPFGLYLIPLSQVSAPLLQRWIQADSIYRKINVMTKNKTDRETWSGFLESFPNLEQRFQDDRFLTTIYWAKLGFFKVLDGHFVQAAAAYQKAIQDGLPAAQLYYNLGFCENLLGQKEKAKEHFKKAASDILRIP